MEDAVGRGTFPQVSPIPILLLENNPGEVLRFKQILSADKRREVFTIVHLSRLEIAANYLAGRPEGPMVIITSLYNNSRNAELMMEHAAAVLPKPVTIPKLSEILEEKLGLI